MNPVLDSLAVQHLDNQLYMTPLKYGLYPSLLSTKMSLGSNCQWHVVIPYLSDVIYKCPLALSQFPLFLAILTTTSTKRICRRRKNFYSGPFHLIVLSQAETCKKSLLKMAIPNAGSALTIPVLSSLLQPCSVVLHFRII